MLHKNEGRRICERSRDADVLGGPYIDIEQPDMFTAPDGGAQQVSPASCWSFFGKAAP